MGPVVEEVEGLTLVDLPHEGEGKQECGDEQEDVHTAGNLAHPDVVNHDEEHCKSTQTLDFGAETAAFQERLEGGFWPFLGTRIPWKRLKAMFSCPECCV